MVETADSTGTSPGGSKLGEGNLYTALILLSSLFVVTGDVGAGRVGRNSPVSVIIGGGCAGGEIVGCSQGLVRGEGALEGLRDKLRTS